MKNKGRNLIEIEGMMTVCEGEQVAIMGDNAEGKTRLVDLMLGARRERGIKVRYDFSDTGSNYVSDNVRYISFRDSYGAADANYYLQLRWNQMEIDEETPTVLDMLERVAGKEGEMHERMLHLCRHFGLDRLLDKVIITLSSGELRKYQLVKSLLCSPKLLIMDNPFIGLDAGTREQLAALFAELAGEGLTIVLVLARSEEIPAFVDTVIPVMGQLPLPKMSKAAWLEAHPAVQHPVRSFEDAAPSGQCPGDRNGTPAAAPERAASAGDKAAAPFEEVLRFRHVSIRYGERTILADLDWTVRRGEHWALTGENGSGKSTLLSLVCADNPQAYACDIDLFGRRRGTGETIWDIKKHIGYVSPEMHRSYCRDIPAGDIVASGLFDTVGLYVRPTEEQKRSCMGWMERFGIAGLAERSFVKLSSGEQRLCLLARAFVKNPDLLILDEPMHGLDESHRSMVRRIVDEYCSDPDITLVMVTHYPEELPSCVRNRLVLHRN